MGICDLRNASDLDPRRLREECIIAFKAYDFCRQQDCLTPDVLGPARAFECTKIGGKIIEEGEIIDPPNNAAGVTVDNLKVKKVIISDKEPNAFKNGFWDVTLKYVFVYKLIFREVDGSLIGCIKATNVFTKKVTLFGSIDTDVKLSTDLFPNYNGSECDNELSSGPFILVESKAVELSAELKYTNRPCCCRDDENLAPVANRVGVTIGLFTIIKLFRIANLTVESRGFCIPDECEDVSPLNPCDFFDNLDFPMDIFAPPQKPEFFAGVSNNIPAHSNNVGGVCGCVNAEDVCDENEANNSSCGCGCNCRRGSICD